MRRGRPTKLSPALQKKITAAIRKGNYREVAAEYTGIPPETMSKWMHRPGEPYESFRQAVLEAERAAEILMVGRIVRASATDANHAKWWLERKFPQRWGRLDRHEIRAEREPGATQDLIVIGGTEEQFIAACKQARELVARTKHASVIGGTDGGDGRGPAPRVTSGSDGKGAEFEAD